MPLIERTKMKKRVITTIVLIAVVAVAAVCLFKVFLKTEPVYVKGVDQAKFDKAIELLSTSYLSAGEKKEVYYSDFLKENKTIGEGSTIATLKNGVGPAKYYAAHKGEEGVTTDLYKNHKDDMVVLAYQEKATYTVNVPKAGLYYLNVDYIAAGKSMSDYTASMTVNGQQDYTEMNTISLPLNWTDTEDGFSSAADKKKFGTDTYGDEMAPSQNKVEGWMNTYLYNNTYSSSAPLCVKLKKGQNVIEFENVSSDGLGFSTMVVEAAEPQEISYEEYSQKYSSEPLITDKDSKLEIDSVYYTKKNSVDAIYESSAEDSLTRFDIDHEKLNILTWSDPGTEVTYSFDVKKAGNYNITLHYSSEKKEFDTFETIKLDGAVPFREMRDYRFKPVSSGYANETLNNGKGENYKFHLTQGRHTITVKQENAPIMEAYRYALLLQKHITDFDLQIKKITGSTTDTERNWKMTKYIKEIPDYLEAYQTVISYLRYSLQDYSTNGQAGAILAYFDGAEEFIKNMREYPDDIALHTDQLTGADNSILVSLSNFTTEVTANKFTLDRIYITGDKSAIGKANASTGTAFLTGAKSLLNTFVSSKYSADVATDEKTVTVWVNRAVTHVDLLQKMADTEFRDYYKQKTGKDIKVKVAAMPDVNKLTLSIAAKETPDVALGLMSYVPFDLSSRGALYDLSKFDDFWTVSKRFPAGAFVSYVYNEGMYAIPETTDFNAIVYRKDIFKQLGLEVPETWDELKDILPTLQRYGKNFYHNISLGTTGYKWFYQTAPMILQNGGKLYVQDESGLVKTGVDTKSSVKGLQTLGDFFTKLSLDTSVNTFFNSFRYSQLPIGIIGMEDYTLINNGAQELDGKWGISTYLGTPAADGTINRSFVANGTGGVIFKDSKKKEADWEFLKWWTSEKVQTEYTYTLRSTYGKTYFWLSANKGALANNPMDEADKQIVLKQIDWVTDVTRTPGQYLLERTISNIWTTMVFDGTSAQVAVDEAKQDVNKEIVRKMQELGYYNDDGKMIKKFKLRGYDWIKENQTNAPEEQVETGKEDSN